MRSQRAAMLAAEGDPAATSLVLESLADAGRDDESVRVLGAAQSILAAGAGDLGRARELAAALDAPERATRSLEVIAELDVRSERATLDLARLTGIEAAEQIGAVVVGWNGFGVSAPRE